MVTQNLLSTHGEKYVFSKIKNRYVAALDQSICLKQIEQQILLLTCAPISEIPSNNSTMKPTVIENSATSPCNSPGEQTMWRVGGTGRATNFFFKVLQHMVRSMVLLLDGISEIGAHARTNLCYFSCLRHSIRSRAVTYRI